MWAQPAAPPAAAPAPQALPSAGFAEQPAPSLPGAAASPVEPLQSPPAFGAVPPPADASGFPVSQPGNTANAAASPPPSLLPLSTLTALAWTPSTAYGRGPSRSLSYSHLKRCLLSMSLLLFLDAALALCFACLYRGMCAPARSVTFLPTLPASTLSACLITALLIAPVNGIAARVGKQRIVLMAVALNAIAFILLLIAAATAFTYAGAGAALDEAVSKAWSAMPSRVRAADYPLGVGMLAEQFKSDAVAVGVPAILAAVLNLISALLFALSLRNAMLSVAKEAFPGMTHLPMATWCDLTCRSKLPPSAVRDDTDFAAHAELHAVARNMSDCSSLTVALNVCWRRVVDSSLANCLTRVPAVEPGLLAPPVHRGTAASGMSGVWDRIRGLTPHIGLGVTSPYPSATTPWGAPATQTAMQMQMMQQAQAGVPQQQMMLMTPPAAGFGVVSTASQLAQPGYAQMPPAYAGFPPQQVPMVAAVSAPPVQAVQQQAAPTGFVPSWGVR